MGAVETLTKFPLVLRMGKIRMMEPRIKVHIETDSFLVETISDPEELKEIVKLRYDIFLREFAGRGDRFAFFPYDIDLHDFVCDHLVVKDKTTGSIVATYRLLFQAEGEKKNFYTEGEFDLSQFNEIRGNKLELGRACVHREYRTGSVISLLWKGLCQYATKSDTRYMFGCSSLARKEFEALPFVFEQLEKRDAILSEYDVRVRKPYLLSSHPQLNLSRMIAPDFRSMPSLMNMYLLAGAKMSDQLAYDEEMDCLDFFTVLDFKKLPASFARRFV
ncbi:MAG: GNAT family N-acyltransferase [Bdellovibrionota bacterium]